MTELDRMILAARQIGEVVGENLLDGIALSPKSISVKMRVPKWAVMQDKDLLNLLTARVWRAVQGWAKYASWSNQGIVVHRPDGGHSTGIDLPSAVAAIHKHWEESR